MASVGELMTRDVLTVEPSDSIGEAAEKMDGAGIGAVVVTDFARIVGIITERDILRAVAARTHSSTARVRQWMTAEPVTVERSLAAEDAARLMLERNFRHLPVVEDGRVLGILSLRDVTRAVVGTEPKAK